MNLTHNIIVLLNGYITLQQYDPATAEQLKRTAMALLENHAHKKEHISIKAISEDLCEAITDLYKNPPPYLTEGLADWIDELARLLNLDE